ncbi:MAG: Crp/Fnr family transcriptional regulator, partial [Bacteroidota bacterium]
MKFQSPYQILFNNIEKHIKLEEEEKQYLISVLEVFQIEKKQYLFRQTDWCNHIFFVTQGLLRSYS